MSPSGNVHCALRDPAAGRPDHAFGCQTRVSVAPAGGPACENSGSNAYMVRITDGTVVHDCSNQGIFITENPTVLRHGQSLSVYGNTCDSTVDGVTCRAPNGHGFTISRDVNTAF